MTALPAPRDNDSALLPWRTSAANISPTLVVAGVRMQLPQRLALAMTVAPVRMQPGRERTQQGALAHDAGEPPRSPPAPPPPVEADSRPAPRRGWSTPRRPVTPRSAAPVLQLPPSPRAGGSGPQLEVSPRSGRPCSARRTAARVRRDCARRPQARRRRVGVGPPAQPPPEAAAAEDEPVVLTERRAPSPRPATASAAYYPYAASYHPNERTAVRQPLAADVALRRARRRRRSPEAAAAAAARACSPPPQPTAAKSAAAGGGAPRDARRTGCGLPRRCRHRSVERWRRGAAADGRRDRRRRRRATYCGAASCGARRGAHPLCRSAAAVPSFAALGGAVGIGGATERLALSVAYSSGGGRLRAF